MPVAILDPFSGIAGDMLLGALIDVGLEPQWLEELPRRLGLEGVGVRIQRVRRADVASTKVDFDIPPQPHGRHIHQIREIVARAGVPDDVRARADAAFLAIATAEGEIHGVPPERVHLHEVGAVDAILDVVGGIWGLAQLGVERVYCGPIQLGDGTVRAAHGVLPVPAPATLKLLEGHMVRPGPEGAGELVTPTGAALVRVLSSGPPPASYVPLRSGYGAGTRDPHGRPNALRVILAEGADVEISRVESLVQLAADIDDMPGEQLAAAVEQLRAAGALDVVQLPVYMKKGRMGTRVEVLSTVAGAAELERLLLLETSTIGVRRITIERVALAREMRTVEVLGRVVRVKLVTLPGGGRRAKAEADDLARLARESGRPLSEITASVQRAAEHMIASGVSSKASTSTPSTTAGASPA